MVSSGVLNKVFFSKKIQAFLYLQKVNSREKSNNFFNGRAKEFDK